MDPTNVSHRMEMRTARLCLRLLMPEDAPALLRFKQAHYAFFRPWWPAQDLAQYTVEGQTALLTAWAREIEGDRRYPFGVFLPESDELIGTATLSNVVRGAFQSADLGYALAPAWNGQGLTTEAVAGILFLAFGRLGLHRVQAAVMPRNRASVRVLEKNNFTRIGLAPQYLAINGVWEDHELYQRLRT